VPHAPLSASARCSRAGEGARTGARRAARAAPGSRAWSGSMQSSPEVRRFALLPSAEPLNPMPPQAIFDDLVFDVPSWGEARIENEEVGLGLFDDAQDTFFGDARSLFAPKIVTPPPSPPEARAKLVHTVSWDGFPVRAPPAVPVVEDDDLSAETPPQSTPQRKRRKSSSTKSKKAARLRGQPCPSELRWAAERTEDMPEKRPVGISLASGSSSGWRLRIAGTQLGHYPSAAEAWAAYPKATADAVAGLSP
jgi:hypothetical protein